MKILTNPLLPVLLGYTGPSHGSPEGVPGAF
nr:MAG TPA: hypothetical protein [Caudoviricetes sp.]